MRWLLMIVAPLLASALSDRCRAGEIEVTDAVAPATDAVGVDIPLLMRLTNHRAEPDALLRVRCPFANFSERHTVDYGEGAPSMRAVPAIPLRANGETTLSLAGYHIMLLQTREILTVGQTHLCTAALRNAGALDIQVRVVAALPRP